MTGPAQPVPRFLLAFTGTAATLGGLALAATSCGTGETRLAGTVPTPTSVSTTAPAPAAPLPDMGTRAEEAPPNAQEAHVGDCYVLGADEPTWGMANVAFVDCAQPHHGQIVLEHLLSETTAIDVDRHPADDGVMAAVDFALEACVMAVWGSQATEIPVGPVLYFPTNLVHDGLADEVMCARESPQLHAGSVVPR